MIKISAPGKIHLLGEYAVVYGKPALLAAVDLRVTVTINANTSKVGPDSFEVKKIIEPIIKNKFNLKKIPLYKLKIDSKVPIGSGLGSSAAVSSAYIAALLTFLKIKWDKSLINELAYEAEKVFHGNPSGADNSAIVYGGLIWYRKETPDLKIIHPLPFSIPNKLAKNFVIINTGKPKKSTKDTLTAVKNLYQKKPKLINKFLDSQEKLVRELLPAIKNADEKEVIRIIREGERNLESIGVCSPEVKKIIRQVEKAGGAAKICGAGASEGPTGVLLCYHKNKKIIEKVAKDLNLEYFNTKLGVEGLKYD